MQEVWVFTGARSKPGSSANFPGGVFSTQERAEAWIGKHGLSGVLTLYRLDVAAYEWAIANGNFKPSKAHQQTPEFIGSFAGGDIHFHYEGGVGGGTESVANEPE